MSENDTDEQQKRLRYNGLIASAVILQNTVDMMRALQKLADDGVAVSGHDVAFFSPYLTGGVKRFGDSRLDLTRPPEPWIRHRLFKDDAKAAPEPTIHRRSAVARKRGYVRVDIGGRRQIK